MLLPPDLLVGSFFYHVVCRINVHGKWSIESVFVIVIVLVLVEKPEPVISYFSFQGFIVLNFQGKRIIKFCEFLSGWPLIICALQAPPLFIANEAFRGSTKCRAVQSEGSAVPCTTGSWVPEGRGRYKRSA